MKTQSTSISHSYYLKIKDPGSALTHFIGMILSVSAAGPLIIKALAANSLIHTFSLTVFMISMILLYTASTAYHTFDISPAADKTLKKIDHCMIFVLIAGSYTPVCMIILNGFTGYMLLAIVWTLAAAGIIFKLCWVTCPKWLSSVIYIAMGWICVIAFVPLIKALPAPAFGLLLGGGIIYTIGGIIYAMKLPVLNSHYKYFGSHELFHIFVMFGSLCHYLMMYNYAAIYPV